MERQLATCSFCSIMTQFLGETRELNGVKDLKKSTV